MFIRAYLYQYTGIINIDIVFVYKPIIILLFCAYSSAAE